MKKFETCSIYHNYFSFHVPMFWSNVTSDKDSFAILPPIYSKSWGHGIYFKPSKIELDRTDIIFKKCISKNGLIHSRYKRQYIPYISKNGQKHIMIIYFYTDPWVNLNWKNHVVIINDGPADCYLEVTINLAKNTFSDLWLTAMVICSLNLFVPTDI